MHIDDLKLHYNAYVDCLNSKRDVAALCGEA